MRAARIAKVEESRLRSGWRRCVGQPGKEAKRHEAALASAEIRDAIFDLSVTGRWAKGCVCSTG